MNQQEIDAARWNALLNSGRLRLLGTAGFSGEDDYRHFGMEFWSKWSTPEAVKENNEKAKEILIKYCDSILTKTTDKETIE